MGYNSSGQGESNYNLQSPYTLGAINNTFRINLLYTCTMYNWAVVVAHLVEGSLPTPEIHGSNSVTSKFYLLPTVLKLS